MYNMMWVLCLHHVNDLRIKKNHLKSTKNEQKNQDEMG